MEFYRPKRKPVNVPIIPLIDILVTLLFFFIVSMAPKQRRMLEVTLPAADTLKVKTVVEAISVLSVAEKGNTDLDGLQIPQGLLKEYLVANRSEGLGEKLEIRMDKNCTLETLLSIQSAVAAAGYQKGEIFHRVKREGEEID